MNHNPISIAETTGARYRCRLPMVGEAAIAASAAVAIVAADPR